MLASDGHEYAYKLNPSPALIQTYDLLARAATVYRQLAATITDPVQRLDAEAQAAACDLVVVNLSDGANAAAAVAAKEAEVAAVAHLDSAQVRPDPPGKASGIRLRDAIVCRPISGGSGLGTLEVGVGDEAELDQALGDSDGQAYWRAQEYGSSHLVGHRIKGLFEPGGAVPSLSEFRVHPVFQVGVPGSRPALIDRPIPAKHFLGDATIDAESVRNREYAAVQTSAVTEMALIRTGNHPSLSSVRRVIR